MATTKTKTINSNTDSSSTSVEIKPGLPANLRNIMNSVNESLQKKLGNQHQPMFLLSDRPERMKYNRVSTGNPALDKILGGGLVTGVPVEIYGPPGTGKAQPYGSMVQTPTGPVPIEELATGDQVLTPSNKISTVVNTYEKGFRTTYRLFFDDNSSTYCCKDHLWSVYKNNSETLETLTLEEMFKTYSNTKYFLPSVTPIDYSLGDLRDDDLLGENTLLTHPIDVTKEMNSFLDSTEEWSPSHNFFYSKPEYRQSFVEALYSYFECTHTLRFSVTNKDTAYNVQKIFHSLGLYCCMTSVSISKGIKSYTLTSDRRENYRRKICSIFSDDIHPCVCIKIDDRDHLYLTDFYIPTHNTTTSLYIANQFIEQGKVVLFVNVEQQTLPIDQLEAAGINGAKREMFMTLPAFGSGENLFNIIKAFLIDPVTLAPRHEVHCIIIDSIAALAPNDELESIQKNGFEGHTMGRHASMVNKFMRQMCGTGAISHESTMILINQLRETISQSGGGGRAPAPSPTGGRAISYYAKLRISLKRDYDGCLKLTLPNGDVKGVAIEAELVKNNTGIPGRKAKYSFIYGEGLDIKTPVIDEAIEYGIIKRLSSVTWSVPVRSSEDKLFKGVGPMTTYVRDDLNFPYIQELVEVFRNTSTEELPEEVLESFVVPTDTSDPFTGSEYIE